METKVEKKISRRRMQDGKLGVARWMVVLSRLVLRKTVGERSDQRVDRQPGSRASGRAVVDCRH